MTKLITESREPPSEVLDDAQEIVDKTVAETVRIEDAVDLSWFVRVEGPTGDYGDVYEMSQEEFESLQDTVRKVLSDNHTEFKVYYGVGPQEDRYLIRIEY